MYFVMSFMDIEGQFGIGRRYNEHAFKDSCSIHDVYCIPFAFAWCLSFSYIDTGLPYQCRTEAAYVAVDISVS